jgi:hypothetical protein
MLQSIVMEKTLGLQPVCKLRPESAPYDALYSSIFYRVSKDKKAGQTPCKNCEKVGEQMGECSTL